MKPHGAMAFDWQIGTLRQNPAVLLGLLAATHALVDGCCAAMVMSYRHLYLFTAAEYWQLVIGYNLLAFGLQPVVGIVIDRFGYPKAAALSGILLSMVAAVLFFVNPYLTVGIAALANALFHAGGGVASMTMKDNRAAPAGIFVGPGAIGLAAGAAIGMAGVPPVYLLAGVLAAVAAAVSWFRFPEMERVKDKRDDSASPVKLLLAGSLLLCVALRSHIGFSIGSFWRADQAILLSFALGAAIGKVTGGIAADRIGWRLFGTVALAASAVLAVPGTVNGWCAVAGMLLLQATMPVTLAGVYRLLPRQPGLSFGLCCLALIIGAAPALTSVTIVLHNEKILVFCSFLAVVTMFAGLHPATTRQSKRNAPVAVPAVHGNL